MTYFTQKQYAEHIQQQNRNTTLQKDANKSPEPVKEPPPRPSQPPKLPAIKRTPSYARPENRVLPRARPDDKKNLRPVSRSNSNSDDSAHLKVKYSQNSDAENSLETSRLSKSLDVLNASVDSNQNNVFTSDNDTTLTRKKKAPQAPGNNLDKSGNKKRRAPNTPGSKNMGRHLSEESLGPAFSTHSVEAQVHMLPSELEPPVDYTVANRKKSERVSVTTPPKMVTSTGTDTRDRPKTSVGVVTPTINTSVIAESVPPRVKSSNSIAIQTVASSGTQTDLDSDVRTDDDDCFPPGSGNTSGLEDSMNTNNLKKLQHSIAIETTDTIRIPIPPPPAPPIGELLSNIEKHEKSESESSVLDQAPKLDNELKQQIVQSARRLSQNPDRKFTVSKKKTKHQVFKDELKNAVSDRDDRTAKNEFRLKPISPKPLKLTEEQKLVESLNEAVQKRKHTDSNLNLATDDESDDDVYSVETVTPDASSSIPTTTGDDSSPRESQSKVPGNLELETGEIETKSKTKKRNNREMPGNWKTSQKKRHSRNMDAWAPAEDLGVDDEMEHQRNVEEDSDVAAFYQHHVKRKSKKTWKDSKSKRGSSPNGDHRKFDSIRKIKKSFKNAIGSIGKAASRNSKRQSVQGTFDNEAGVSQQNWFMARSDPDDTDSGNTSSNHHHQRTSDRRNRGRQGRSSIAQSNGTVYYADDGRIVLVPDGKELMYTKDGRAVKINRSERRNRSPTSRSNRAAEAERTRDMSRQYEQEMDERYRRIRNSEKQKQEDFYWKAIHVKTSRPSASRSPERSAFRVNREQSRYKEPTSDVKHISTSEINGFLAERMEDDGRKRSVVKGKHGAQYSSEEDEKTNFRSIVGPGYHIHSPSTITTNQSPVGYPGSRETPDTGAGAASAAGAGAAEPSSPVGASGPSRKELVLGPIGYKPVHFNPNARTTSVFKELKNEVEKKPSEEDISVL
ncbi:unnamed protein product [Owenia fusiformis]|uniref:Uncharacterized protein n=1 Tax=Owenia fusiformis TaxID=6347 RepID=A0A8J1Y391_OWEFU|nr:unnamed protein product [Owenia fusiformis]